MSERNLLTHAIGRVASVVVGALTLAATCAYADSIAPTSFSADVAVGDSVTIHKTVTVDTARPRLLST